MTTPKAAAAGVDVHDVEAVNAAHKRSLYQKRIAIHPKRMDGTFRRVKWAAMAVLLGIYYLTPWIRWDRGPGAPDQAVLIDFPGRRFYFFFIEIWPQEVYYITGLLILAAVGLFLATAIAGRLWCGYACPQTVWTDLFIAVENMVEGDRNARMRLDKAPWTGQKVARKTIKHAIWLIIAVLTGGAWVFYFADAPTLARQLLTFDAPAVAYITIGVLTSTTYLLGGFAREQVCTYMCPWPRIQGAMLDEDSLAVTYRRDRGEPRGPHKKNEPWEGRGDCIDCKQCVAVCPMGIDIRDGLQLECIQCALCIDACNDIMGKIGRPKGLIAYDTDANIERRKQGLPTHFNLWRPRVILYAVILLVVALIMTTALVLRSDVDVNVIRDRNPLFVMLSDGSIRNGYTVKILNKRYGEARFQITAEGLPGAKVDVVGVQQDGAVPVGRDDLAAVRLFVTLPRSAVTDKTLPVTIRVRDVDTGAQAVNKTSFRGPER
jgi:cytochrome c oxidase accessory protein FixG